MGGNPYSSVPRGGSVMLHGGSYGGGGPTVEAVATVAAASDPTASSAPPPTARPGGPTPEAHSPTAALIPRAKFSWASESFGTQSTIITQRTLGASGYEGSGNCVPEPSWPVAYGRPSLG